MRALVTGATGFIASYLVKELRARGWELICLTRRAVCCDDPGIVRVVADLLNPQTLDLDPAQVGSVDTIFHLAAMLPQAGPVAAASFIEANGVATMRLLDLAARLGVEAFVYVSSQAVINKPQQLPITEEHPLSPAHPYALGKLSGELACEMVRKGEGRRITSLRITSPYGIGMAASTVLTRFVQHALNSENLLWFGSGERTQDFVHVKDVVDACLLAAATSTPGVYNIGSGVSVSMRALANMVLNLLPNSRSKAFPAGVPDPQDDFRWEVDITKARSTLGYRPAVQLEAGLLEYIDFIRAGELPRRWCD